MIKSVLSYFGEPHAVRRAKKCAHYVAGRFDHISFPIILQERFGLKEAFLRQHRDYPVNVYSVVPRILVFTFQQSISECVKLHHQKCDRMRDIQILSAL